MNDALKAQVERAKRQIEAGDFEEVDIATADAMTDDVGKLVERLRSMKMGQSHLVAAELDDLCLEAADAIERLQKEGTRMFGALNEYERDAVHSRLPSGLEIFYSEEDEGYIAVDHKRPGCNAWGDNERRALVELDRARTAWDLAKAASLKNANE